VQVAGDPAPASSGVSAGSSRSHGAKRWGTAGGSGTPVGGDAGSGRCGEARSTAGRSRMSDGIAAKALCTGASMSKIAASPPRRLRPRTSQPRGPQPRRRREIVGDEETVRSCSALSRRRSARICAWMSRRARRRLVGDEELGTARQRDREMTAASSLRTVVGISVRLTLRDRGARRRRGVHRLGQACSARARWIWSASPT
jgi:hypothetical protein